MVGGGQGAFIGAVHRIAARIDDQLRARRRRAVLRPGSAQALGRGLGLAPDRTYGTYEEMARREARAPDGIEAVAIVTPNHMHFPAAKAFLEAGIHVICDKPLTTTLARGEEACATRSRKPAGSSRSPITTPAIRWCGRRARWSQAGELGDDPASCRPNIRRTG